VRDVAEAYKHVVLTRDLPKRTVTRYDQTAAKDTVYAEGVFEEGVFEGELTVTGRDGISRPLAEIMENVMAMWESLLERMML
jgi:hypothetical protein